MQFSNTFRIIFLTYFCLFSIIFPKHSFGDVQKEISQIQSTIQDIVKNRLVCQAFETDTDIIDRETISQLNRDMMMCMDNFNAYKSKILKLEENLNSNIEKLEWLKSNDEQIQQNLRYTLSQSNQKLETRVDNLRNRFEQIESSMSKKEPLLRKPPTFTQVKKEQKPVKTEYGFAQWQSLI